MRKRENLHLNKKASFFSAMLEKNWFMPLTVSIWSYGALGKLGEHSRS